MFRSLSNNFLIKQIIYCNAAVVNQRTGVTLKTFVTSNHLGVPFKDRSGAMPGTVRTVDPRLGGVPDVVIDDSGKFKYILCKVFLTDSPDDHKLVVRGTARAEFHAGIYDELDAQLENSGVSCQCLGGGKIDHSPDHKTIVVFGLSQGFGRANHATSVDILKQKYTDYSVTWKDD